MQFIGRQAELAKLNEEYSRDGSFVVIYGRRRVGKTTLIRALHLALCLLFIQLPVYFWSVSVLPDVIPLSIRFMPFLMTSFAFSVLSVSSRARMESSKIHSSGFPISSPLS